MKYLNISLLWIIIWFSSPTLLAKAPTHLGGFVLGDKIESCQHLVFMDTCLKVRYMEYIEEAEIRSTPGFKSGLIAYGTCKDPGKILRIKLKYSNSSKEFYHELLKRFKKRFGDPVEWRGDPFHIMLAWKWSFVDKKLGNISLILQHNTKDTKQKIGNAVKLTLTSQMEEERQCAINKEKLRTKTKESSAVTQNQEINWKLFIPY